MSTPSEQANGSATVQNKLSTQLTVMGKLKLYERQCLRVELAGLCVLIAIIWTLLAIPIFIFHLSEIDEDQTANISAVLGVIIETSSNISNTTCPSQCSEAFHCKQSSQGLICAPTCQWQELPDASSDTTNVVVMLLVSIGVVVGIVVIISGCIRWKQVFTFPSILVIYHNITWLVMGVSVFISLTDPYALYCVADDMIESVLNPTGFCVFTGVVFYYGNLQMQCWWICHVSILFWKVAFPFRARSMEKSKRIRYVHAACVLVSLLLPLLPILVIIGHDVVTNGEDGVGTVGFTITRFPPLLCTSVASEATFYSLVLPLILILDAGLALLIIMFWIVHKQSVSFNAIQEKSPLKIGTAEKKLMVIIIYYVILSVFALTTFTNFSRTLPLTIKELFEYFICEQPGPSLTEPCDRSGFNESLTESIPSIIAFVLLALIPWPNLIFTVNISELKDFFKRYMFKTKQGLLNKQKNSTAGFTSDNTSAGDPTNKLAG